MSDLRVCSKCGWHDLKLSGHRAAGAAADALAAAVPVESTKLGYGGERLTFTMPDIEDQTTLIFQVYQDGTFRLAHAGLPRLSADATRAIVLAIRDAVATADAERVQILPSAVCVEHGVRYAAQCPACASAAANPGKAKS
jgi:hypothetical protein